MGIEALEKELLDGVGLLGILLVASGFLLILDVGLGYDLFILLKSSLVIRPSGGGVCVLDWPLLGEFEAEDVPNRPFRFNEVGLADDGLELLEPGLD